MEEYLFTSPKIKIFMDSDIDVLERQVNSFLSEDMRFKLKYSTVYRPDGSIVHSVLIKYRTIV